MTDELFDTDEVPFTCPACGAEHDDSDAVYRDERACSECYVNPDCPDGCNEPHDAPNTGDERDGEYECPTTGVAYEWCSECSEWNASNGYGNHTYTEGVGWLCNPYEHGFAYCDGCSEYRDENSVGWDEEGDTWLCGSCYESRPPRGSTANFPRCGGCRNPARIVAVDVLTERGYCERCATDHAPHAHVHMLEAA